MNNPSLRLLLPRECAYLGGGDTISVSENIVILHLPDLVVGESHTFRLDLRMPGEDYAGQNLDFSMDLSASLPSNTRILTSGIYSEVLRCAIDPNDKQVFPRRLEPTNSNYTQTDETLDYLVRFQNTGNDTAFTVRIEDQLSENLDWATFKPLAASHPYTVSLRETRPVITNTVRSTFVEFLDRDEDGALFYEDCVDTDPNISPFPSGGSGK